MRNPPKSRRNKASLIIFNLKKKKKKEEGQSFRVMSRNPVKAGSKFEEVCEVEDIGSTKTEKA
jgi:hypothetical protein